MRAQAAAPAEMSSHVTLRGPAGVRRISAARRGRARAASEMTIAERTSASPSRGRVSAERRAEAAQGVKEGVVAWAATARMTMGRSGASTV